MSAHAGTPYQTIITRVSGHKGVQLLAGGPRTAGPHPLVFDLFRIGRTALCVCSQCDATWNEGSKFPEHCRP
jgi:hypothetical protein